MEKYDYFREIIENFKIEGKLVEIEPYGSGHINKTYLFSTKHNNENTFFILQEINISIFPDPFKIQSNIERVINHINSISHLEFSCKNPIDRKLKLFQTKNSNSTVYKSYDNKYWRIFNYINSSNTYDVVQNVKQANQAGRIIGKFHANLLNFPVNLLNEIIPNFHNLPDRYTNFIQIYQKNSVNRNINAKDEIQFIMDNHNEMSIIHQNGLKGRIPLRVTHNDTKFNNILFDPDDNAICLIDLDTIMPGFIHYDYGDALRTITTDIEEDEPDLNKIKFKFEYFQEFTRGYLSETLNFLTETEIALLSEAPIMMTFLIGLRFLTDYLNGDEYFATKYDDHNLIRAKNQFHLVKCMLKQKSIMKSFILDFVKNQKSSHQSG